ncbi:nuclear transport factor 2 family protein [Promicromonospora sp. Populi]|uniref:nuclear transport factor 2 family protein n=1 Tax=Promicromonospora sp. Populi TaxID=3239420 RepID=UPI0034E1F7A6
MPHDRQPRRGHARGAQHPDRAHRNAGTFRGEGLERGRPLLGEPYVQHNPTMPNGLEGLRTVAPQLAGFSWTPARIAAQGDLVMTHSRVLGWAPEPVVIVDIFRLKDSRIVEHWDVVQTEVPSTESINGNPMV